MSTATTYRPDIDGLRAVAVLTVILFHYKLGPFTGGYAGVDVFFVISGFLITSIIVREAGAREFSLLGFYARRVRRILPALLTVILCTLVAGYFVLAPGDYRDLGRQASYAVLGASNFYFLSNTGYFDQAADLQPLLHTWSLGVEEQFYVIWPLALFLVSRSFMRWIAVAIAGLFSLITLSLGWSIYMVGKDPSAAFYMPHTRAWELALGALLAFAPSLSKRLGDAAGILGSALILYAVFSLDAESPFPGVNALFPCLGAVLLIWPKQRASVTDQLLATTPAVLLGQISYSLYLWHWPIFVFFRHFNNGIGPTTMEALVLLVAVFVLSVGSWLVIEKPARRIALARATVVKLGAVAAISTALASVALAVAQGLPNRLPPEARGLWSLDEMWRWRCKGDIEFAGQPEPLCVFGENWDKATHKVLLWGDSHADHFAPIIEALVDARPGVSVVLYRGCAPAYGGKVHRIDKNPRRSEERCKEHYARATALLQDRRDISAVLLAASWTGKLPQLYQEGAKDERSDAIGEGLLREALQSLEHEIDLPSRHVFLLTEVPRWGSGVDPVSCAIQRTSALLRRPCFEGQTDITKDQFEMNQGRTNAILMSATSHNARFHFVPVGATLCSGPRCIHTVNGEFIYRDNGHLRRNLSPSTRRELGRAMGLDRVVDAVSSTSPMPRRNKN